MLVGVPIFDDAHAPAGLPLVQSAHGWASPGQLLWAPCAAVSDELGPLDGSDLAQVEDRLAEILLLPELAGKIPSPPTRRVPPGEHPLWGRTYHVGPPIGGENKRWIVVSNDHFNRATGRAICVRTTSNLSYEGPTSPTIEAGNALAICDDVTSRSHERFMLASSTTLPQCSLPEMTAVARGLVNALQLARAAGLAA